MDRFGQIRKVGGKYYQSFLDAGYREYYHGDREYKQTNFLLQKPIYDSDGAVLFFIDIWCYDWSDFDQLEIPFSISPHVQFNVCADQFPIINMSLNLFQREVMPQWIEDFFLDAYYKLECQPYRN